MSRKKGGRELPSFGDDIETEIQGLEQYTKKEG